MRRNHTDVDKIPSSAAIRIAHKADDGSGSSRAIFCALHHIEALSPIPDTSAHAMAQQENQSAWAQLLVSRILPLVLPPEDLCNPCLHILVAEVLSEVVIHNVLFKKFIQPWLVWEAITKLVYTVRPELVPETAGKERPIERKNLENSGLLSSVYTKQPSRQSRPPTGMVDQTIRMIWWAVQAAMLIWMVLRALTTALLHPSSLPSRQSFRRDTATMREHPVSVRSPGIDRIERPLIAMRIWTCISHMVELDQRMPWLSGAGSLVQWMVVHGPGRVCRADGIVDR